MFNKYVKLDRLEINKYIPRQSGVYIILIRLFKDMKPVPIYVGATGENKTLRIRLKRYVLIIEQPERGQRGRPIHRLLAGVPSKYFMVTYFCTGDFERVESLLINRNSVISLPYLVNGRGKGRSADKAHQIVDNLVSKINFMEKENFLGREAGTLKGTQIVHKMNNMSKIGIIVDISTENNSLLIYWGHNQIEEVPLIKFLYSMEYRFCEGRNV
jgi:hypothetical protein